MGSRLDDNAVTGVQVLPELVVFSDWWGEVVFELRKSIFDGREKEEDVLVG